MQWDDIILRQVFGIKGVTFFAVSICGSLTFGAFQFYNIVTNLQQIPRNSRYGFYDFYICTL
jgi:hypothetical protein